MDSYIKIKCLTFFMDYFGFFKNKKNWLTPALFKLLYPCPLKDPPKSDSERNYSVDGMSK